MAKKPLNESYEFEKNFKKFIVNFIKFEKNTFRDFMREVAKGDYKYLVGIKRNGQLAIKDVETGNFAKKQEVIDFINKGK